MEKSFNKQEIKLYHMPPSRSTRPLYLYKELEYLYGNKIPKLNVHEFSRDFKINKPE